MDQVSKYLSTYAEPEVDLLGSFTDGYFQHVLIIPAYRETTAFIDPYINGKFSSILLILVINQPNDESDCSPQQQLYNHLDTNCPTLWHNQHLTLFECADPSSAILCIRRYEADLRMKPNQGVGIARKVAADCALKLTQTMHVGSHWIASTDADAELPDDYFSQLQQQQRVAALTFNFQHHVTDDAVSQATQLYEQSLHYYQAGLAWAGSTYAFYSLGSCIAINTFDYAKVRGFPKRSGGEDFYLLNKLAKIGTIQHCPEVTVTIRSRCSDRVPFGTGPAVAKILQLESPALYQYYHPEVFRELQICLHGLSRLSIAEQITAWQDCLEPSHFEWLTAQGLERIFLHQQRQNITQEQLQQHITHWFDGLMTLRFIHHMRDTAHSNCYLVDALENSPFYSTIST